MSNASPKPTHLPLVDGLRGYLIVAMTVGHFIAITGVTSLNFLTHKPFSVFLTGEGFMAVSGFMAGYVLTLGWARKRAGGSIRWGLHRAGQIVIHYWAVFALCALPALVWRLEGSFASALFHGRSGFSLGDWGLLASGLYRPGFFDILYLYVVFVALAPLVLILLRGRFWAVPLALSLLAWLLTQYGLTERAFALLFDRIALPMAEAGSFHIFAWQLLFFWPLALGHVFARKPESVHAVVAALTPALPLMLTVLGAFAALGLASALGIVPLGLRYLQDYLTVAPLPLMNFLLACLVLAVILAEEGRAAGLFTWLLRLPPLRTIGAVTLQSFCASIVLSYWVAYTVPAGTQTTLGFGWASFSACLVGVWVAALVTLWLKRRK